MSNDHILPHRQIRKQEKMTKLPVTEISSKLHVIKTMTTGMVTLLMATIIKKIDKTKYKKYFWTYNGSIIGYVRTSGGYIQN